MSEHPEKKSTYSRRRGSTSQKSQTDEFAPGVKLTFVDSKEQNDPAAISDMEDPSISYKAGASPQIYSYLKEKNLSDNFFGGTDFYPEESDSAQKEYMVQADTNLKTSSGKNRTLVWLVPLLLAVVIAALLILLGVNKEEKEPTVITAAQTGSPEEVRAFTYGNISEMTSEARTAISRISGTVDMEIAFITSANVVTRNLREDGQYDFYVFDNEGNLQWYFEKINRTGVFSGENNLLYAAQSPFLINTDGTAPISEKQRNLLSAGASFLFPMHEGWSILCKESDNEKNMININGELFSEHWMCRLFPFSGDYTLGCIDTGNLESNERYVWYILGKSGSANRWFSSAKSDTVLAVACDLVILNDGSIYALPGVNQPVSQSAKAVFYPDLHAAVLWDENGKCGLWMNGGYFCPCNYQSISPVEGDLEWDTVAVVDDTVGIRINTLSAAAENRPISCTFTLKNESNIEYISISVVSASPYDSTLEYSGISR